MATEIDGETKGCFLQWKIENISHCWLQRTECMYSLPFTVDALEGTKWHLWLYPMGKKLENTLEFYLYRETFGPDNLSVNYQLAFLGKDGSFLKETSVVSVKDFKKGTSYGFNENETRENVFVTGRETYLPDDTLTVQLMLWGKGAKPIDPKHLYVGKRYKVTRRSFNWRVEKFSTLKSGVINQFRDISIGFDLVLSEGRDFEKTLALKLSNAKRKYFSLKFSVLDSERKKEDLDILEYFEDDLCTEVFSPLLFTQKLLENKSRYLPNDVLSLDCEYAYSDGYTSYEYISDGKISPQLQTEAETNTENNVSKKDSRNAAELGKDLEFMYNNDLFSDVEVRTLTKTFHAHKIILSARSIVFRSMFRRNVPIEINDFADDTIRQMLLYLYTDSLEDLCFESARNLYRIAHTYHILSLRNRCSTFLKDNLAPTNACGILVLADLHNDDDLKSAVQEYIVIQRKLIICSPKWKNFMSTHIKLAADVMYKKIYEE